MAAQSLIAATFGDGGVVQGATITLNYDDVTLIISSVDVVAVGGTVKFIITDMVLGTFQKAYSTTTLGDVISIAFVWSLDAISLLLSTPLTTIIKGAFV
jgi:hypothetical protein